MYLLAMSEERQESVIITETVLLGEVHPPLINPLYMWQSQVEIQQYFVAYFDHAIPHSKRRTAIKGRAHMRYIDLSAIHASLLCV